jgi:polyisoprenoid-binding protein YceI
MQVKALKAGIATLLLSSGLLSSGAHAEWTLDSTASSLYYVTSKAGAVSEVNTFGGLSGGIADDGTATLTIDLASVNTAVEIRDQRMRDIAFKVGEFPSASITVKVQAAALDALPPGTLNLANHTATVSLHGMNAEIVTELHIVKLDADTLLIQLAKPLLVNAGTFGLAEAVEELRTIANLPSINPNVVVDFTLVYNKQ